MRTRLNLLLRVMAVAGTVAFFAASSDAKEDFYKGKMIRIIVGFSAGGGFDAYSRAMARHMGKHIPGNPNFIVENMTGAGSLIAANYIYNRGNADGLTMGNWSGALVSGQLFAGKGINFDARKFEWVGVPVTNSLVCVLLKASGVTTLEEWFKAREPVKLGGLAPGNTPSDVPRILAAALKLPIKLVEGYKGTANIRLAVESGEVAGGCLPWESIKSSWKSKFADGSVIPVLQVVRSPLVDLPNVPNAIDLAKNDEARNLIKFGVSDLNLIVRSYTLPPGTPKERVNILRNAFKATMQDPEFLAELGKAQMEIEPIFGDELEGIVRDMFTLEPSLVARLKKILFPTD